MSSSRLKKIDLEFVDYSQKMYFLKEFKAFFADVFFPKFHFISLLEIPNNHMPLYLLITELYLLSCHKFTNPYNKKQNVDHVSPIHLSKIFQNLFLTVSHSQSFPKMYYHYTNHYGAMAISNSGYIQPSEESGGFGPGVYLTDLNPYEFFRDEILSNNYGGIQARFANRADWVVEVYEWNIKIHLLHRVNIPGNGRRIFVYPHIICVQPHQIYDKPRCYRDCDSDEDEDTSDSDDTNIDEEESEDEYDGTGDDDYDEGEDEDYDGSEDDDCDGSDYYDGTGDEDYAGSEDYNYDESENDDWDGSESGSGSDDYDTNGSNDYNESADDSNGGFNFEGNYSAGASDFSDSYSGDDSDECSVLGDDSFQSSVGYSEGGDGNYGDSDF